MLGEGHPFTSPKEREANQTGVYLCSTGRMYLLDFAHDFYICQGPNTVAPPVDTEDFGLTSLFNCLSLDNVSTNSATPHVPERPPAYSNPITKEMLVQIREDIGSTRQPDWQGHLPVNFGSPEHGKLKADQWRMALEFDIPVFLICIKS